MTTLTTHLRILVAAWFLGGVVSRAGAQPPRPDPHKAPGSPVMLDLPASGTDPDQIDYNKLPRLRGTKVVISPRDPVWKFQLHSYLVRREGLFGCMWNHGPAEDDPTQHLRYATSKDGLTWGASKVLAGPPDGKKDPLAEIGFRRHFVDVKDAKLSYVVRKAAGPTLVLIPGSFDCADSWLGVVTKLDPGLQIVIVELRGHGQSWPPPTPETGTIEQFAQDVFACTDHAGIQSFYVGGHSIGGMVAIECAGQRPGLLRGVLSIEGWTRALIAGRAFKGKATDSTLSDAQKKRRFELRRPTTSRWTREQLFAFAQIWEKWDGTEILDRTPVPVLELWGDRGDARPSRKDMRIPDRDNIDLVWVTGASHFLPLERPEETAAAAGAFIRKVEAARQR